MVDLDALIRSWADRRAPGVSSHAWLEIANAVHLGHKPGDSPPLRDGEPVPGCSCVLCVGERPATEPARPSEWFQDALDRARGRPILDVVQMLGLGDPIWRGRECRVRCPLHDDERPSLTIDPERDLWFCFPCAVGGDGIELYRLATGLSFGEVVRELAA